MIKSYRIRLIPTEEQEKKLWDSVHAARYVWNWGLAYQMERFKQGEKHLSGYDLKKVLTQVKKQENFMWLAQTSNKTLSMALLDLDNAYQRFFTVQKKGEKFRKETIARAKRHHRKLTTYDMVGHPKFKKRDKAKPSFYANYEQIYFTSDGVVLEKIGKVAFKTDYSLPLIKKKGENKTKFTNPRISFVNGKWILSVGIECENQARELNDFSVGIDLGVKDLAVISYNGESNHFKNINKSKRVKRLKKRLKRKQRNVSRKYEQSGNDSKRIRKEREEVSKLYRKLANIRHNHTHHVTSEIINLNPRAIVIEDLNVAGMMKNKHLSEVIAEQNLHEFRRQLEYKAEWAGIEIVVAGKFYPSSKKCSCCGAIKRDLKLKDRVYKCDGCGLSISRDLNAAKNLEKLAV